MTLQFTDVRTSALRMSRAGSFSLVPSQASNPSSPGRSGSAAGHHPSTDRLKFHFLSEHVPQSLVSSPVGESVEGSQSVFLCHISVSFSLLLPLSKQVLGKEVCTYIYQAQVESNIW